jgi:murein L,D-transpeptidase YafK
MHLPFTRSAILLVLALPIWVVCRSTPIPEKDADGPAASVAPPEVSLSRLLDSLAIPADSIRIRVEKSTRSFSLLAQGIQLKVYPCVLGQVPMGDKRMQGDRRTPEGHFAIRSKYPHKDWHKFVWIDYPNAESRRRFQERKRSGEIPSNADIGGEIGIHGVPSGMDHWIVQGEDWTWGCIALRNADLDEVYPFIQAGKTTITIVP